MQTLREYFKKEFEIEKAELQIHIDTLQSAYEKEIRDHNLALKTQKDKFEEQMLHLKNEIYVLKASNTQLQDQIISKL